MKRICIEKPYNKIKLYILFSISIIIISVIAALIISYVLYDIFTSPFNWCVLILGFILIIMICAFLNNFIFSSLVKKEVRRHSKFLYLETNIFSLDEIIQKPNIEKVNDKIYNYIFENSMLNVISFYYFNNDITKKEIDGLRKTNNTYLKKKYPIARETNSRKKHLKIKTQIYISNIDNDLMKILTIGGERLYEIGFIRCCLDLSSGRLYIPFFKGDSLSIHALINYDRNINKLIKLFNVGIIKELK